MIEQTATVTELDNGMVCVETDRQAACGSCSAKAGCGKSLLDNIFKPRPVQIVLENTVNAKLHDKVIIGLDDAAMLQASFYLYLFPLLVMLVTAILTGYFISPAASEIYIVVAAFVGLFVGSRIAGMLINNKLYNHNEKFRPKLLRVSTETFSSTTDVVFTK